MVTFKDKKFTQNEIDKMIIPISQDLIAYYKILESAIFELIGKAQRNGWTEEQLFINIDDLFTSKQQKIKKDINMPTPKDNESQENFIARCVPYMMDEGKTQDQALGECYGIYRNYKKEKMFKTIKELNDKLQKR